MRRRLQLDFRAAAEFNRLNSSNSVTLYDAFQSPAQFHLSPLFFHNERRIVLYSGSRWKSPPASPPLSPSTYCSSKSTTKEFYRPWPHSVPTAAGLVTTARSTAHGTVTQPAGAARMRLRRSSAARGSAAPGGPRKSACCPPPPPPAARSAPGRSCRRSAAA